MSYKTAGDLYYNNCSQKKSDRSTLKTNPYSDLNNEIIALKKSLVSLSQDINDNELRNTKYILSLLQKELPFHVDRCLRDDNTNINIYYDNNLPINKIPDIIKSHVLILVREKVINTASKIPHVDLEKLIHFGMSMTESYINKINQYIEIQNQIPEIPDNQKLINVLHIMKSKMDPSQRILKNIIDLLLNPEMKYSGTLSLDEYSILINYLLPQFNSELESNYPNSNSNISKNFTKQLLLKFSQPPPTPTPTPTPTPQPQPTPTPPSQPTPPPPPQPGHMLNMKYKDSDYVSTGTPDVWGPLFWFSLHNGALRYPKDPSNIWKERMKNYIFGIPVMVPCEKCSIHASAYIESQTDIDTVVTSREKLFEFFWKFHNFVNKKLGKKEISLEEAYSIYNSRTDIKTLSYSNDKII